MRLILYVHIHICPENAHKDMRGHMHNTELVVHGSSCALVGQIDI